MLYFIRFKTYWSKKARLLQRSSQCGKSNVALSWGSGPSTRFPVSVTGNVVFHFTLQYLWLRLCSLLRQDAEITCSNKDFKKKNLFVLC